MATGAGDTARAEGPAEATAHDGQVLPLAAASGHRDLGGPEDGVPGGTSGSDLLKALKVLGSVVAPAAFITALLYYFGWVRTGAVFSRFGVEQSMLGFSTNDYLLRSAGVAFRPIALLVIGAAGVFVVHRVLHRVRAGEDRAGQVAAWAAAVVVTVMLAIGVATLFGAGILSPLLGATVLVFGSLLLEAVAMVAWPGTSRVALLLRRVLLLGVLLLGSFWACAVYAQESGSRVAAAIAADPSTRTQVVVYSAEAQHLEGDGVSVRQLGDGKFAFRYDGLRLLIYTHDRWFLLPREWRDGHGRLIILRDDAGIRVEVAPGTG